MNNNIDFTIGADPEFTCSLNGKIVVAENVITDYDEDSQFGCDGNGVTFEVRPSPSKNPIEIVNNIRNIFVKKTLDDGNFLKYNWVSRSWYKGYPLGGHIHFGVSNHNHIEDIISVLDNYLGSISILLEINEDGLKRRREYGCKGDFRKQEWGFEYRPLSSWVSSPYTSSAILCLAKTIVYEFLNNKKFEWNCRYVNSADFLDMNQKRIISSFPDIWRDIRKMNLYQCYKPYIDLIYFMIKNKLTWHPSCSMKESWAISDINSNDASKIDMNILWHSYNQ